MRPLGRIRVKTETLLPETPRPADVVAHCHGDQYDEREEASSDRQFNKMRLILHVHEKQDHYDGLEARDGKSDNGVQDAKVDVRCSDCDPRKDQQCHEDNRIRTRRNNLMIRVLRI